jgi:hypothetical protein
MFVIMWTGSRRVAQLRDLVDAFRKAAVQNDQENSRPTA